MKAAVNRMFGGLLLATAPLLALSQPTAAGEDRTFFGYQMGERVSGSPSDFGPIMVGPSKFLHRKFYLSEQESPSWATDKMRVVQIVTPTGRLVEAVFTVDVFRSLQDRHDQRNHTAKVKDLVSMVTAKVGQLPTSVTPWPKRMFNPADLRTPPIALQSTEWDLPWGQVTVIGCSYITYPYYDCEYNDARPSIIVRTKPMVEAIDAMNENKRQQQQQVEQNRRKL